MSATVQQGRFFRIVLWMLALLLVAAGITIDHKYGGFSGPQSGLEAIARPSS